MPERSAELASMSRRERLAGGLVGLLVGDAVGVPYEFNLPEDLPPQDALEMVPPVSFRRSHSRITPGTWSDDGAQALCLLASLLEKGRLDPDDLGQRVVRWLRQGYMAVDGNVFDVGIQTSQAISALELGAPALTAGRTDERANGNGSLMRVLPLALWHKGSDEALVADAHWQSRVTHGHVRSQVCCALYCLWAREFLEAEVSADPEMLWQNAVKRLRAVYQAQHEFQRELEEQVQPDLPARGQGTGYVLDCLRSARQVQAEDSFERVVKAAIALGHDTDTTACVAGGIAGLRFGLAGIPERWWRGLRGKSLLEPLLEGLLSHHGMR